ncbi:putative papain-like cysteine peptidase superfamily [Helianthus anomalus]
METVLTDPHFKGDLKDRMINNYDQVFIPIIWAKHFYVICFNLQSYKVDILDNSAAKDNLSVETNILVWLKNGNFLENFLLYYSFYLKRHTEFEKKVSNRAAKCFCKLLDI